MFRRSGRPRQALLPFVERTRRRGQMFRGWIVAITAVLAIALVAAFPAGRFHVQDWAERAQEEFERRVVGEVSRERIEARWKVRRARGLDLTYQSLASFYRETTDEIRGLFDAAKMDPAHALVRYGRADQGFVISPEVFEKDDRGRSYRLRPGTRSVWLRQITLRNGPFGLFEVLDTPEHRAAAGRAGAIVDERSIQHTNSWGLRGPEPDLSAPVRGIALGDSFMQGMFNGDDDTPPICLERYLRSAWKMPVTVVNTGHIGYSPEQYYYTLLEYGDRVKPRFVVVSVCPNDFGDGAAVLRGQGDWFDEARHWLAEIRRWCASRNVTCLLVPVPTHLQVEGVRVDAQYPGRVCSDYHSVSSRYCDPLNDFTDEFLRLRRIAEREGRPSLRCELYNYQIEDDHFSPKGAALWAQVVGRRLTLLVDPAHDDTIRAGG